MINIRDLVIDTEKSFKGNFLIADITPLFPYENGVRGSVQKGYTYTCVLPELKLERLSVKIEDLNPLVDLEKEDIPVMAKVKFQNLVVSPYISNGNVNISAKADKIMFVDAKEVVNK